MKTTRPARIVNKQPPEAPARSFLSRHRTLWPALLIVLVGGAAYANSLRGVFLFDDLLNIVSNPTLRQLPGRWRGFWRTRGRSSSRRSSLNYAWSASRPWSYHLVNVAVHLLAALALFGIVRRTLELPARPSATAHGPRRWP